jgi:hypothetical protein
MTRRTYEIGDQDDGGFREACRLRALGYDEEQIFLSMKATFPTMIGAGGINERAPFTDADFRRWARSACKYEVGDVRRREPDAAESFDAELWDAAALHKAPEIDRPTAFLGQGFRAATINAVVGASNVGKTFFGLELARCIALGIPFGGLETTMGSVLFVSCELGQAQIKERLSKLFMPEQVAEIRGLVKFIFPKSQISLDRPEHREELRRFIIEMSEISLTPALRAIRDKPINDAFLSLSDERLEWNTIQLQNHVRENRIREMNGLEPIESEAQHTLLDAVQEKMMDKRLNMISAASFVLIDSLSRVKGGRQENSNDDMGDLFIRIEQEVARPTKAAIVLLHHTGKLGNDGQHRGARGASAIIDVVRDAIEIRKEADAAIASGMGFFCKASDFDGSDSRFSYKIEDVAREGQLIPGVRFVVEAYVPKVADEKVKPVERLIRQVEAAGSVGVTQKELVGSTGVSDRRIRKLVSDALFALEIHQCGERRGESGQSSKILRMGESCAQCQK